MGEIPQLAMVRDTDHALCSNLSAQIQALGIQNVALCTQSCADIWEDGALRDAPTAGVLVTGIRDAILGPAHVADLRLNLPGWVIIVIDHVADEHSSADALAAGADDVLRMPYPPCEFEARLALRMRQAQMSVTGNGVDVPLFARAQLTPMESEITRVLIAHKGRIVTRNQLSQKFDQSDWLYGDRKFDVHITKIRKKLQAAFGERYIVRTIRSKGYTIQLSDDQGSA